MVDPPPLVVPGEAVRGVQGVMRHFRRGWGSSVFSILNFRFCMDVEAPGTCGPELLATAVEAPLGPYPFGRCKSVQPWGSLAIAAHVAPSHVSLKKGGEFSSSLLRTW